MVGHDETPVENASDSAGRLPTDLRPADREQKMGPMGSNGPIKCAVTVDSLPSTGAEVCRWLLSVLEQKGFSQDDMFAVHLAVEEAFLNAVKHGNKMDPRKKVSVEYTVDDEKVEVSLADEGEGFDPQKIPDPRMGRNLYRPDGRGMLLMGAYMDVVEYNQRGNSVRMVRYREKPLVT